MNRETVYYCTGALLILFVSTFVNLQEVALAETKKPETQSASISTAIKRIISILKKKGVSKLPSASQALNSTSSSSLVQTREVSGTPPLLSQIPTLQVRTLFWRQGVVSAIANGNPNQSQCAEFFSSPIDGNSAGLGACHLTESVGRSFQTILDAETSLCYVKNLPTKENFEAGGVQLISGKFPGNNITKLFLAGEKTRLVKINTPAFNGRGQIETIFVKIPSTSANEKANRLYRADLYFCPPDKGPRGFNILQISDKGVLKVTIGNSSNPFGEDEANTLELKGTVKAQDGSLSFNTTKTRTMNIRRTQEDDISKVFFELTNQDTIKIKRRDKFGQTLYKDYSVARYSGTNALDVQFLEGGFKGETTRDNNTRTFSGGTEFRDTFYTSAPNDSYVDEAEAYDISSDSFYEADASVDVNTDSYSCSAKPTVEITLVDDNPTLEASLSTCFTARLENMNFCRQTQLIRQAEENFVDRCVNNPPP